MNDDNTLKLAMSGDITAFQKLFAEFQPQLKSYLYRLVTDRSDAEDLTHDAFVKAFDKIHTFKGESSLKTWVFSIATNLAFDQQKRIKRWRADAQDESKALASGNSYVYDKINFVSRSIGEGAYEIKEHIDFCFTCISKTLPIEKQVAFILREVYDFSVKEIALILNQSMGIVKHLLVDSRKLMTDIFDKRCALVNKQGTCYQCTELNRIHNPKQEEQEELMKLEMYKENQKFDKEELFQLRVQLIKAIDPLQSKGAALQDVLMRCTRKAIGEIEHFD